MKTRSIARVIPLLLAVPALAQSNIDATSKFAWGENIGWLNWRDANSAADGVRVNATFLEGWIWAENVGWINTGNGGAPYANTDGSSFGVNIGPGGFLNGFAWGENIGWINFDTQAAVGAALGARFDSAAGRFRGYAWGENVGWINLDDGTHFVAVPPACCPGNADKMPGAVTFSDVTAVLANFGVAANPDGTSIGDSDCNGSINFADVTSTLANFLMLCP